MREKPIHLAAKLRTIRQRLGLRQTEMVHPLNIKGHHGRRSEYELSKRQPSVLTLLAYAHVAGIHIDDLVDDEIELKL